MASNPRTVIANLKRDIGRDFADMTRNLDSNLRANTPIQTGQARNGWRNTYRDNLFKQRSFDIEENRVDYIGVLDTGTSRQAPRGIVQPAMRNTRRLS